MKGYMAKSIAGHDKGSIYIIVEEDAEYVYVADGRLKLLNAPKKKKMKHIQVIKSMVLEPGNMVTDEQIKRIIKLYQGQKDSGGIS